MKFSQFEMISNHGVDVFVPEMLAFELELIGEGLSDLGQWAILGPHVIHDDFRFRVLLVVVVVPVDLEHDLLRIFSVDPLQNAYLRMAMKVIVVMINFVQFLNSGIDNKKES